MDVSCDLHALNSFGLSETNCVSQDIFECNQQEESPYASLASDLVREWLNQALDSFDITFGNILHQSDSSPRNGIGDENFGFSSYVAESSVPSLKQLCLEVLGRLDNNLMVRQDEQDHVKYRNVNESYLEYHGTKEVGCLKLGDAVNHCKHNSASSKVMICEFTNSHNLIPANTGKAEQIDLQNVDEMANQFETAVGQLSPTVSPDTDTSTVEGLLDSFSDTDVSSNLEYTASYIHSLINSDIGSRDRNEYTLCKETKSSSDTVLSEDWNFTDDGSQVYFSGPGVQVSLIFTYYFSHDLHTSSSMLIRM